MDYKWIFFAAKDNGASEIADLGRFFVQENDGEPAVIALAMDGREDDHYISAVNDEDHHENGQNADSFVHPENLSSK